MTDEFWADNAGRLSSLAVLLLLPVTLFSCVADEMYTTGISRDAEQIAKWCKSTRKCTDARRELAPLGRPRIVVTVPERTSEDAMLAIHETLVTSVIKEFPSLPPERVVITPAGAT